MDIKRIASQPSAKEPPEYFTGTVRIDIMSDRLTAIKGRGGFTDFPVSIQYLGEPAPCILKE